MTCVLRLFYSHKGSYIEYVGEGDGVGWGMEGFCGAMKYLRHILMSHEIFSNILMGHEVFPCVLFS